METNQDQPFSKTPASVKPTEASSSNKIILLIIVTLILLGGSILTFFIFNNSFEKLSDNLSHQSISTKLTNREISGSNWTKPPSNEKGFPVIKQDKSLSIYSLQTGKLKPTKYKSAGIGGSAGFGSSDPHASPDLLYTAFINADEGSQGDVSILSNETLEAKKITATGNISFISGWSPNSKKLIYHGGDGTITEKTRGMGIPSKSTFSKDQGTGFFLFDIESGRTTHLYPVEYFETFIDDHRILVRATDQGVSDRLIIFDLDKFEADYETIKDIFPFGALNFSISDDGTKWTYMLSRNPINDANIIYADFSKKEGIDVDSGVWAEFQFPKISSDGTRVAYSKQDGYEKPGSPNYAILLYDSSTKTKTKLNAEGFVAGWADNQLIIKSSNASERENYLYLLDLSTGKVTKIY